MRTPPANHSVHEIPCALCNQPAAYRFASTPPPDGPIHCWNCMEDLLNLTDYMELDAFPACNSIFNRSAAAIQSVTLDEKQETEARWQGVKTFIIDMMEMRGAKQALREWQEKFK